MTTPTYAVQMIRRDGPGAYEPECSRTTHRLTKAAHLLVAGGATWHPREHAETCSRHPDTLARVLWDYRSSVVCNCGRDRRPGAWDAWVTDEMIQKAYDLACQIIERSAAVHHRAIAEARASRKESPSEHDQDYLSDVARGYGGA